MTNSDIMDWKYAKEGIELWLNNNPLKAESHFKAREENTKIFAGFAFTTVMNAVISYETDKIDHAQNMLKELENRCTNHKKSGQIESWINSFKSRVFGYSPNSKPLIEILEEKIILADSLMCSAILTFLTQDIGGLIKGSWLLRKAWKMYQQTYGEIYEIYTITSMKEGISKLENAVQNVPVYPIENFSPKNTMPSFENRSSIKRSETTILSDNNVENLNCNKKDNFLHHYNKTLNQINSENSKAAVLSHIPNAINLKSCLESIRPTVFATVIPTSKIQNNAVESLNHIENATMKKLPSSSYPSNRSNLRLNLAPNNQNGLVSQVSFSCPEPVPSPHPTFSPLLTSNVSFEVIKRLMGAISFGYGIFQLSMSLLPPNFLRLISFFGFVGDKNIGISCLMYSKGTEDMRAPLSMLSLLWYYTIGTQLFHLDGNNMQQEIQLARELLRDSQSDYATSAIFLFFRGRLKRLQCKIDVAIDLYDGAYRMSAQKELKLLCLHEVGWCRLIQLDFGNAMLHFHELKLASNFSKIFYTYMMTICTGAFGRFDNLINLKTEILDMINKSGQHKETQINKFILRRIHKLPSTITQDNMFNEIYWKFFVYEMLFLWNTLCSCNVVTMDIIIADCSNLDNIAYEPSVGLADLILGSCKTQQQHFQEAIEAFRQCIRKRENINEDAYLSAFACYELAMLLIKEQTEIGKQEAKEILSQAQKLFKNYDFENRLSTRIYSALRNLEL